jgi:hypothetical protein
MEQAKTTTPCECCNRFEFLINKHQTEPYLCIDCQACPKRLPQELETLEIEMENGNITEGQYLEECSELKYFYKQFTEGKIDCNCPSCQ